MTRLASRNRKGIIAAAMTLIATLTLSGCEESRNHPSEQAADYKICSDAGMQAFLNSYLEVKCSPPRVPKP